LLIIKKLFPEKGKSFIDKNKIDLYLSLIRLELAPSEWVPPGLLAGHRASTLTALFIKRLFNCDNTIAILSQPVYKLHSPML